MKDLKVGDRVRWTFRLEGIVTMAYSSMIRVLITKSFKDDVFTVGNEYPIHECFLEK
jgi:hypothetical protein